MKPDGQAVACVLTRSLVTDYTHSHSPPNSSLSLNSNLTLSLSRVSRWDFCSWDLVEARWTASLTYVRHLHMNMSMRRRRRSKEVIQPHMDQPALIFISGDDSDITADENGSLDITRRKRECIGGGSPTRQSRQLTIVVSDFARIAEGSGRSSQLIIKDIRHRDNSPRQIAGLWEIEERGAEGIFAPIISGSGSDEEVDDEAEVIIVADEKAMQRGAVSG